MARYKHIDTSPRFLAVDLERQLLPGSFEHALHHLIDHEIDLTGFDARYKNDLTGAAAYPPGMLLKVVLYAKPKISREHLPALIAQLPPCVIGMEACSGAHYRARQFRRHGHTMRVMDPKFATPCRGRRPKAGANRQACRRFPGRLCGTLALNNLGSQSLKVLFVGYGDEICQALVVLSGVKRLAPRHCRSLCVWPKSDGEHEMMTVEVFDLEELIRNDACEAAFVRVALAVRPVHG